MRRPFRPAFPPDDLPHGPAQIADFRDDLRTRDIALQNPNGV
jgi:hypothetical protein